MVVGVISVGMEQWKSVCICKCVVLDDGSSLLVDDQCPKTIMTETL